MEKHIYNEQTGISYTLHGDYYLPALALPAEEQVEVGIWGQRHLQYIKAKNQMEWVARMNNIRSRATEIVNHDIIYS